MEMSDRERRDLERVARKVERIIASDGGKIGVATVLEIQAAIITGQHYGLSIIDMLKAKILGENFRERAAAERKRMAAEKPAEAKEEEIPDHSLLKFIREALGDDAEIISIAEITPDSRPTDGCDCPRCAPIRQARAGKTAAAN